MCLERKREKIVKSRQPEKIKMHKKPTISMQWKYCDLFLMQFFHAFEKIVWMCAVPLARNFELHKLLCPNHFSSHHNLPFIKSLKFSSIGTAHNYSILLSPYIYDFFFINLWFSLYVEDILLLFFLLLREIKLSVCYSKSFIVLFVCQ